MQKYPTAASAQPMLHKGASTAPLPMSMSQRRTTDVFFLVLFILCALLPQLLLAGYAFAMWMNQGESSSFSISQHNLSQAASSWSRWLGVPLDDLADQVGSALVIASMSGLFLLHFLRVMMVRAVLYTAIFGSIAALLCAGLGVSFGGLDVLPTPLQGQDGSPSMLSQMVSARLGDLLIVAGIVEAGLVAYFWNQIWLAVGVLRSTQEFLMDAGASVILCQNVCCGIVHAFGIMLWSGSCLGAWTLLQAETGVGQVLRERYAGHVLFLLVLCYFWGNCFVSAVSSFTVAAVSAEWYYTSPYERKRVVVTPDHLLRVLKVGLFRHGGSLALGALLLALVRTMNFFLFWASRVEDIAAEKRPGGSQEFEQHSWLRRSIRRTREGAGRLLEALAHWASKQAYVEIAVTGSSFLRGAAKAATRAREAPKKFLAVEAAGFLQRGSCEVLLIVTAAAGSALVSVIRHGEYHVKEVGVACFVAWLIAESVLHPVSLATTAILHCLLIDKCQAKLPHTPRALARALQNAAAASGAAPPSSQSEDDALDYAAHYRAGV
mmetsp:Transcript_58836/g.140306  ORF Transcript_58836/g.140306 Transcript_58836/m.140306 type:complete len:549 (+) Transcript_58836:88-1734(+)